MRLNAAALALAAGITTALIYAVCAVIVAIAPGSTTAVISYLLHLDLTALARPLTWGSFATGIVCVSLAVAFAVALLGALYNRFAARTFGVPASSRVGTQHG